MLTTSVLSLRRLGTAATRTLATCAKPIDPYPISLYDETTRAARRFCQEMDSLQEVHAGVGLLRLRACEDPDTMVVAPWYGGKAEGEDPDFIPLPQSEQMGLENRLMLEGKATDADGYFSMSTSHRDEEDLGAGRRLRVFPILEVEKWGNFSDLLAWQAEFLMHMGFEDPIVVDYREYARFKGVTYLNNDDERALAVDVGPVVQLINHPAGEDDHGDSWPFFNMRWENDSDGVYARKCDVIIDGVETFGSAERETCPQTMLEQFHRSVNGRYAARLFRDMGEKVIMDELNEYLALFNAEDADANERFGMGVGWTRFMAAYAARMGKWGPSPTSHGEWVSSPDVNARAYQRVFYRAHC